MTAPETPGAEPDARTPDWSDLTAAWTEPSPDAEATHAADRALIAAVKRRDRLGRLNFWSEAAGGVLAGAIGLWAGLSRGAPVIALAAVAFCGFAVALTLWARRGVDAGPDRTPHETLRHAATLARSGLRWARAGQLITLAAAVFVAVILWDSRSPNAVWTVAICGLLGVGALAFYQRHAHRSRRRLREAEAALAALEAES